jgi:hypothetical protein
MASMKSVATFINIHSHYCRYLSSDESGSLRRNDLEEALAAFLVVPSPQNMLISVGAQLDKESASYRPDSAICVCRLLESLVQQITNGSNFTALSATGKHVMSTVLTCLDGHFSLASKMERIEKLGSRVFPIGS